MTVVLGEPIPYYLELEPLEDGTPRMRITIYNIPESSTVEVRRSCEGETWPVPGLRSAAVNDTAVFVDWCCPLNRDVTYTVLVGGQIQSTRSSILPSVDGWLQDPIRPDLSVPVSTTVVKSGALLMIGEALKDLSYANQGTEMAVMGDRYPRMFGGQRSMAGGVNIACASFDRAVDAVVRQMIASPILLLRPSVNMYPLPPLAYLNASVTERPINIHIGGEKAQWDISGNLVAAVAQAAVTGQVTYEDVQALLGGYTYGQVQEIAGATTYLDWLKDPLLFTNLSAPSTMSTKV